MLHLQQVLLKFRCSRPLAPDAVFTNDNFPALACLEHACSYVCAAGDFKGLRAAEQAVAVLQVMQRAKGTPRHSHLVGKQERYQNGRARAWPVMNVA